MQHHIFKLALSPAVMSCCGIFANSGLAQNYDGSTLSHCHAAGRPGAQLKEQQRLNILSG